MNTYKSLIEQSSAEGLKSIRNFTGYLKLKIKK